MTAGKIQAAASTPTAPQQRQKFKVVASRPAAIAEFQSDAIEVEERAPPRVARMTLYAVVALILAAVTWACLSSVDAIVTAPGKLITTSPNLVVQPLETSVIREVHVKVGDTINRLDAELNGRDFTAADPANPDNALQARLFIQRKAFYETSLRNYDAQIASAQANLKTSQDEEPLMAQRLETLRSIEAMREGLMEKQSGSRLNFLLSHDARLEVENNLSRARGNQVDLIHRLEKVRGRAAGLYRGFWPHRLSRARRHTCQAQCRCGRS